MSKVFDPDPAPWSENIGLINRLKAWLKSLFTRTVKEELKEELDELKAGAFKAIHDGATLFATFAEKTVDELISDKVESSVAGHVLNKKKVGETAIITVSDASGISQIFIELKGDFRKLYSSLNVGDIIGASGQVGKVLNNELAVLAKELKVLSKKVSDSSRK